MPKAPIRITKSIGAFSSRRGSLPSPRRPSANSRIEPSSATIMPGIRNVWYRSRSVTQSPLGETNGLETEGIFAGAWDPQSQLVSTATTIAQKTNPPARNMLALIAARL